MSYPDNRLIVNGVDLTLQYGLILLDGYSLDPPEPKTYEVDIPGGDGVIDLTEALLGDTAYKNRKMEFTLCLVEIESSINFQSILTDLKRFLHGKAFDFKITIDPDYTYHGRFTLSDISQSNYVSGIAGTIKITVDADPYKYRDEKTYKVNAIGGITVFFDNGRKRVRPVIETDGSVKVIFNRKLVSLPQGTWTVNDILFKEGPNEIYFNSYDIKSLTWGNLKTNETTWGDFKGKKLYEWYKSQGNGVRLMETWDSIFDKTWGDLSTKTWGDLTYMSEVTGNVKDVYVKYKAGDL